MTKQLSRRKFLGLTTGAIAGGAIAACAAPAPQVVEKVVKETVVVEKEVEKEVAVVQTQIVEVAKEVQVTAPPPVAASGEVIFWGHDDHPMDLAATGFMQQYPEVTWVSPHPADWGNNFKAAMAAGEGCPDLYWAEATDAKAWGCADLLVDLSEHLAGEKDNYHPLKWNETLLPNQHNIGWPGDISVSGWYYRSDILEREGLGGIDFENWTYDEFIEMSKALAAKGMYTFCMPASGWYLPNPRFNYLLHQVGGTMVTGDGQQIVFNDEKGLAAMTLLKQLYDSGGGLDVEWLAAPYFAAMKADELIGQFAAAWETGFWESNLTTEEGGLGTWRVAQMPKGADIKYRTAIFGGAQLVMPQCAVNKDNALLYMKYALGSLEGTALCGRWGIIPSYRPYLQSPLFLRDKTALFGDWAFNEFWAGQEKELSLEYHRPAGWGECNVALEQVMPDIMSGAIGIQEGLDKAVELATPDFERVKCPPA